MANPLFSAMNAPQMNGQMNQLLNMLKSGGNPTQMLMQMAQTNPQARQLMQALQNGANPQQLFYQECQKRGLNPNDILNQIK